MSFAIFYLSNWINLIPCFIYPKTEFNRSLTWPPHLTRIPRHPHQPTWTSSSHCHQWGVLITHPSIPWPCNSPLPTTTHSLWTISTNWWAASPSKLPTMRKWPMSEFLSIHGHWLLGTKWPKLPIYHFGYTHPLIAVTGGISGDMHEPD